MSISLVAVFIPILFMGGIVGRLFREFAVTLSVAIGISLVVSLSTTPMMCSRLLQRACRAASQGGIARWSERGVRRDAPRLRAQPRLGAALCRSLMLLVFVATVALNIYLYIDDPQGLLPAAGHRAAHRLRARRPVDLVPGDAAEARPPRRHRAWPIRRWTA